MTTKPTCVTTWRVSAPCGKCGLRTEPIARLYLAVDGNTANILCAQCCPAHSIPTVTRKGG